MGKDPAFLFYTSDFLTGIMFMTNEQVGIYIKLLCIQHQHKGLIDKGVFEAVIDGHTCVRRKFIETDKGYYNPRLMEEMEKRQHKSKTLSANALVRWNKEKERQCKCIANVMHTENENKDKDLNTLKTLNTKSIKNKSTNNNRKTIFKKPTVEEIMYVLTPKEEAEKFFDHFESNGWKVGGKAPMKDWKAAARNWMRRVQKDQPKTKWDF